MTAAVQHLFTSIVITGIAALYGALLAEVFVRGVDSHGWWRRP